MQATEATRIADMPVQGRAITRYAPFATISKAYWNFADVFFYLVYDVISAYQYLTYESFNSATQEKSLRLLSNPTDGVV